MDDAPQTSAPPIIVCAPMPRSGTTYCKHLINIHPQVYRGDLREDYLLINAENISSYVDSLYEVWDSMDDNDRLVDGKAHPDSLMSAIGSTLLRHIGLRETSDRMVLKTPRLYDLEVALRLFPGCQIVILVRDPRSIISSYLRAQKGWGLDRSFEEIATQWASAMRYLSEMLADNQEAVKSNQLILLRYEKLVSDTEAEYRKLLEKLGLSFAKECAAEMRNPTVRGSSFLPLTQEGRVDFTGRSMPENFDPMERWKDWTTERHARFNRICGSLMKKWGYEPVKAAPGQNL